MSHSIRCQCEDCIGPTQVLDKEYLGQHYPHTSEPQWVSEPPTEPGWYRVIWGIDNLESVRHVVEEMGEIFVVGNLGHLKSLQWQDWKWDHRPVEFLPPPDSK